MTFYTIKSLGDSYNVTQMVGLLLTIGFIVAVGVIMTLYYRHHHDSKYRDIGIMLVLVVLFLVGLQIQQFDGLKRQQSQRGQVAQVLRSFAKEKGVPVSQVSVNTTQMQPTMIVRNGSHYYQLDFAGDNHTYTKKTTYLVLAKSDIKVK